MSAAQVSCSNSQPGSSTRLGSNVLLGTSSFNLKLRYLRYIKVEKVSKGDNKPSSEGTPAQQMQLVKGELWSLVFPEWVEVLDTDGTISDTFEPGFRWPSDMCAVGDSVVVADRDGLVLINSEAGNISNHFGNASYLSVTACPDGQSIWAVEQESWAKKGVWICHFHIPTGQIIKRLHTKVNSDTESIFCALLDDKLYLSCYSSNKIYEINTNNGSTITTFGKRGSGGPGRLDGPYTIYADEQSHKLLVNDRLNHRLQILDPVYRHWSVVETIGEELKWPKAVGWDENGQMWVSCDPTAAAPNRYFKCTVMTPNVRESRV